jgi:hypothetical protein
VQMGNVLRPAPPRHSLTYLQRLTRRMFLGRSTKAGSKAELVRSLTQAGYEVGAGGMNSCIWGVFRFLSMASHSNNSEREIGGVRLDSVAPTSRF